MTHSLGEQLRFTSELCEGNDPIAKVRNNVRDSLSRLPQSKAAFFASTQNMRGIWFDSFRSRTGLLLKTRITYSVVSPVGSIGFVVADLAPWFSRRCVRDYGVAVLPGGNCYECSRYSGQPNDVRLWYNGSPIGNVRREGRLFGRNQWTLFCDGEQIWGRASYGIFASLGKPITCCLENGQEVYFRSSGQCRPIPEHDFMVPTDVAGLLSEDGIRMYVAYSLAFRLIYVDGDRNIG